MIRRLRLRMKLRRLMRRGDWGRARLYAIVLDDMQTYDEVTARWYKERGYEHH